MKLYHSTSAEIATKIMSQGFRDGQLEGVTDDDFDVVGVCFADRPILDLDGNARSCEVTIEVDFSDVAIGDYEVIEEGKPSDAFREWFVPSHIVNMLPRRQMGESERAEF